MKKEVISIKGTISGLVICIDKVTSEEDLILELRTKIEARPGFFKNAKFKLYPTCTLDTELLNRLIELCCTQFNMNHSPEIIWPYVEKSVPKKNYSDKETVPKEEVEKLIAATNLSSQGSSDSSVSLQETLLIQKNLRSGQKLHYPGNIVILGDVNPGAEVSAGGDIIVMGSLRGIAHAGAYGNEKSIILAYNLEPTQLRIADKITRPPEKDHSIQLPEMARLAEGQMYIEPYRSQKTNWEVIA